jgi:hypothetical protein
MLRWRPVTHINWFSDCDILLGIPIDGMRDGIGSSSVC